MNLFIKERFKIQKVLFFSCLKRRKSYLSGVSLFFLLLYWKLVLRHQRNKIKKKYWNGSYFNFRGIKLTGSAALKDDELKHLGNSFEDSFFIFLNLRDRYDLTSSKNFDLILFEGPYCYRDKTIDVTVNEGDVVFDCGAWIGDFSAYASHKGAKVFSFEPFSEAFSGLEETARLNKSVFPIKFGLSDRSGEASIEIKNYSTAVSQLRFDESENFKSEKISLTTIDEFVKKENLQKVDFIKADIEGHERFMLMGAKETLKKFAPKLAICTYHLPDDPEVLSKIILEANPAY